MKIFEADELRLGSNGWRLVRDILKTNKQSIHRRIKKKHRAWKITAKCRANTYERILSFQNHIGPLNCVWRGTTEKDRSLTLMNHLDGWEFEEFFYIIFQSIAFVRYHCYTWLINSWPALNYCVKLQHERERKRQIELRRRWIVYLCKQESILDHRNVVYDNEFHIENIEEIHEEQEV